MKILEEPHQDPQRSLRRSLKILKDLKKIFTRDDYCHEYTFHSLSLSHAIERANVFAVCSVVC